MKVIIAGGRNFNDAKFAFKKLDKYFKHKFQPTIVHGDAEGADKVGGLYAKMKNHTLVIFPANWDRYGRTAGYIRNLNMADYATHLVAFWDGESKGTKHMIEIAKKKGLKVKVIRYDNS